MCCGIVVKALDLRSRGCRFRFPFRTAIFSFLSVIYLSCVRVGMKVVVVGGGGGIQCFG